jgi:predicted acetyltransferase
MREISLFEFATLTDSNEELRLRDILCQSFRLPTEYWESYVSRIGRANYRILRSAGRLVGGLAIYRMGQWFGGRCLNNAGIAAVGIAPEDRSAGAAAHLMTSTLAELYEQGVAISALYASTQRLYRRVGYEQAGSRYQYRLPLASIGVNERSVPLRRIDGAEHDAYHATARARAKVTNGNLERNAGLWERIVTYPYGDKSIYRYLIGEPDRPEGYLFLYQDAEQPGPYHLYVRDMVALSPAAARRLWTFFSDHRSVAETVLWYGPAVEPLLMQPTELVVQVVGHSRWMLRMVDVRKALHERGYLAGIEGELHFEVEDDVLPPNNGRFILTVTDGSGQVRDGGRGDLKAHIRGVSPLFSGFLSPAQLQAMGQLEANDQAIAVATSIFAGPPPWMPDMF